MVKTEYDYILIHYVKGMTEFPGVSHSRNMLHLGSVLTQKFDEAGGRPVGEAEDDSLVHLTFGCVSSDSPQNRESLCRGRFNRIKVALFHVRPDSMLRGGKMHHVPFHVALHAECQVDKSLFSTHSSHLARKDRSQLLCPPAKNLGSLPEMPIKRSTTSSAGKAE